MKFTHEKFKAALRTSDLYWKNRPPVFPNHASEDKRLIVVDTIYGPRIRFAGEPDEASQEEVEE